MLKFILITLNVLVLINLVCSDRTKDKIYENVAGHMCFRRLNATHQTGCTSNGKSSVGVLHLITSDDDINFLINDPPAPPYAPIVTPKFFNRSIILKLRDSTFVSAIVLVNDTENLKSFSNELKCPNSFYRHDRQPTCDESKLETVWNPFGSGLLHENFDIPIIFLAKKNESDKVIKCFNDFNKDFRSEKAQSLCSIEINAFMSASGNSEICMRRTKPASFFRPTSFCDPLQGKNIYATLHPRKVVSPMNRSIDADEKFILVSARLDTTSMFDGIALGAMDSLTSIATLFASAHFLRKISSEKSNLNVLFVLFNGESYDYIGSQRLVYDLKKKNAFPSPSTYTNPLTLENIVMMIDLGSLDEFDQLAIYHLNESDSFAKQFGDIVAKYNQKLKLNVDINAVSSDNLPPVSAQTFLRENISFPSLIISTKKPENRFYHSVYDDAKNLNYSYLNSSTDFDDLDDTNKQSLYPVNSIQIKIRNVASLLSLGLYEMIYNHSYDKSSLASSAFVDEILYCYLVATKCRLFESIYFIGDGYRGGLYPPQRYVSVQPMIMLEATGWAYRIFGFALSEKVNNLDENNCTILPHYWMPGVNKTGECRLTTQNVSYALSPAFDEEGYNFASKKYSTWTESTWNDLSARIFLRPSSSHDSFTFTIGVVALILSFAGVYFINSKAEILFGDVVNAEHVSLPAQC